VDDISVTYGAIAAAIIVAGILSRPRPGKPPRPWWVRTLAAIAAASVVGVVAGALKEWNDVRQVPRIGTERWDNIRSGIIQSCDEGTHREHYMPALRQRLGDRTDTAVREWCTCYTDTIMPRLTDADWLLPTEAKRDARLDEIIGQATDELTRCAASSGIAQP